MSGLVQGGVVIGGGANLAIGGERPSGLVVQGQVVWRAQESEWELIAHSVADQWGTVTLDSTGADLVVIVSLIWAAGGTEDTYAVGDSLSNEWVQDIKPGPWWASVVRFHYCIHPRVGVQHSFWNSGQGPKAVLVFRTPASIIFDQVSSPGNGSATIQVPSLTPLAIPSLFLTAIRGTYYPLGWSVDSGFSIVEQAWQGGYMLGAVAMRVQDSLETLSPRWALTSGAASYMGTAMISFREASWQLLASSYYHSVTAGQATATTSAIDTTGADLLVMVTVENNWGTPGMSDSVGNVWMASAANALQGSVRCRMFYCIHPVTSASHRFYFGPVLSSSMIVLAIKGPSDIAVDQASVAGITSSQTLTVGPLTPSANNSLILAGAATQLLQVESIDAGFSLVGPAIVGGQYSNGGGVAMLEQGVRASVSPTFSFSYAGPYYSSAAMLCFRPA